MQGQDKVDNESRVDKMDDEGQGAVQEVEELKEQIVALIPEMAQQISCMEKQDILEILQSLKEQPAKTQRQEMIEYIMARVPGCEEELEVLDDGDVRDIYEGVKERQQAEKQKLMQAKEKEEKQKMREIEKMRSDTPEGVEMLGAVWSEKKAVEENGQLNIYEMKKTLIQRLPQFRNEIKELSDDYIRTMYNEIRQEEENKQFNQMNPTQSNMPFNIQPATSIPIYEPQELPGQMPRKKKKLPPEASHYIDEGVWQKSHIYQPYLPSSSTNPPKPLNPFVKEPQKKEQQGKHFCKISFYLDRQDFEQDGKGRMNGLKKVISRLHNWLGE